MNKHFEEHHRIIQELQEEYAQVNNEYFELLVKVDEKRYEVIDVESRLMKQTNMLHRLEVKQRFKKKSIELKALHSHDNVEVKN